jgi:hypothetical protein
VTFDLTLVTLSISNNLSRFQKDRAIVNALKKMMGFKQNQPTNCTHHLLGAFVAAHPQISVNCQELMIAFPQKSLLLEVKAVVESDCSSLRIDFCWLALEKRSQLVSVFQRPCQLGCFPCPRPARDLCV